MAWTLAHWPWLAGGGIVLLLALVLLAPAAALRLVGELAGWAMDKVRQAVRWLRKPGNGRRAIIGAVFLCLAVWAATASLSSWQRNAQIIVVTRERDDAVKARDTAVGERAAALKRAETAESQLAAYRQQERDYAAASRRQADALEEARARSSKARAEAAYWREVATKGNRAWQKAYDNRPDSCKAAIEALDAACPALRGY